MRKFLPSIIWPDYLYLLFKVVGPQEKMLKVPRYFFSFDGRGQNEMGSIYIYNYNK